jgi:hypothetical protein
MKNEQIQVDVAKPADRPYIIALQKKFSNQIGFLPTAAIDELVTASRVLVGRINEEPAGYFAFRQKMRGVPNCASIVQAAVQYDAQRLGVAMALENAAAELCRNAKAEMIQAWCRSDLPANLFWDVMRYRQIAQRHPKNARKRPIILWRKPLTPTHPSNLSEVPRVAGCRTRLIAATDQIQTFFDWEAHPT